ncbi:M4 family metallopeptidase [Myroides odoratus]|uniref:M4 family metallopeptidase n=1 Tax=Myroides odoratus TaxID=256 RepID=UPI00333E314B
MKKKYIKAPLLYVALASFLFVGNGYADIAKIDLGNHVEVYATDLPTYKPLNTYGSFAIRMNQKSNLTEQEFLAKANEFFGLNDTNTFELLNSYIDARGVVHNTYQHYVGKYPVDGQMFIVHSKKGKVTAVNGTIINIENKKSPYSLRGNIHRKPTITSKDAVSIAFKVNQIAEKPELDAAVETVFIPSMKEDGVFVLAHKVRVDEMSSRRVISKNVYVSVENGEVVNEVSLIAHANVPGSGDGQYRSNLPLGLTEVSGRYQLYDNERKITTYDASAMRDERDFFFGRGPVFNNATTTFPKNPANEIHWGLANTYDYYKEIHNRDSYDARGGKLNAYYNPVFLDGDDNSGMPENAYAMPYGEMSHMVFGRGSAMFNPLVSIDVAAHEYTHLVIANNGNDGLRYQGESGALNEGFADIFGTSVEHYAVNDADWLMGKGIIKSGGYSFMRDMQDPKNNRPGGKQPNTYKGEYWASTGFGAADAGGVHTNSGVINYWYYLISEGGSGVNDKGDDYVVSGVGIKKAEQIAYETLKLLTNNAQYINAVEQSKMVAEELYGVDSEEYFAVHDAWYAVGFGERRPNMGVEDFELAEDVFSLYPNPVTNGELTVLTKDDKGIVAFYNMAGQKVTQDFTVEKGENTLRIPQLKTGNYIVIYESKERKISEKIIVK